MAENDQIENPAEAQPPEEGAISADDWAAAMVEQSATEANAPGAADDWSAAMAEQQAAEEVKPAAAVFENFSGGGQQGQIPNNLDLILDIPVNLTVELGRTKIAIRNLLQLAQGSVVELDEMAGEPMRVLVNGTLIAQGEVVVVNEKFGIRVTDIITPAERLRRLHK